MQMKRTVLIIAALITACVAAQAQLLYRITGGGLKAPSYIVGTYHLAPPAFADSITGLKKAIDEVAQVYGEVDMAVMMQPANVNKVRQAMDMTDGTTLDKLLSPDEMNRLNALMKELFGADLTHPVLAQQMNKLSPQAMVTQLTMLMFLKRTPNFDASSQLDGHIQNMARDKKKKVGGLETIDDQIKALYKGIPYSRQKTLLMCLVDNRAWMEQQMDDMVKAYFSQDLDEVQRVNDETLNSDCDATDEEKSILVDNRNDAWMKKLPALFKASPTLVAVGAAHLVGEKGLLAQLRKAGYTVEGVK